METRKQAILRAVVHEFTTSAVPVGSQALQSRYFVNLSSATIRSELAELAEAGYLAQPHTSAGRIPTDSGYRYFVDFLMDLEAVPESGSARTSTDELRKAPSDVQGLVEKRRHDGRSGDAERGRGERTAGLTGASQARRRRLAGADRGAPHPAARRQPAATAGAARLAGGDPGRAHASWPAA